MSGLYFKNDLETKEFACSVVFILLKKGEKFCLFVFANKSFPTVSIVYEGGGGDVVGNCRMRLLHPLSSLLLLLLGNRYQNFYWHHPPPPLSFPHKGKQERNGIPASSSTDGGGGGGCSSSDHRNSIKQRRNKNTKKTGRKKGETKMWILYHVAKKILDGRSLQVGVKKRVTD